jgi:hypothetical protein
MRGEACEDVIEVLQAEISAGVSVRSVERTHERGAVVRVGGEAGRWVQERGLKKGSVNSREGRVITLEGVQPCGEGPRAGDSGAGAGSTAGTEKDAICAGDVANGRHGPGACEEGKSRESNGRVVIREGHGRGATVAVGWVRGEAGNREGVSYVVEIAVVEAADCCCKFVALFALEE